MAEEKKAVIYGTAMGNFDVDNILKYIDLNSLSLCTVYLEKEPVESVLKALTKDKRVEVFTVKNTKKEAKMKAEEYKANNALFKLEKLEKVSDRSSFRGGC